MKTRYFRLLLVLMLCCVQQMAWAETKTVTIGTGTDNANELPYGNYYMHSTCQSIYTPEEIGYTGRITSIAYNVASATYYSGSTIKVYMGYRTNKVFTSNTDCVPYSDLTLVYSGTRTIGGSTGWESITLTTPFNYDGKKNLVVVVTKANSSYKESLRYYYSLSPNGYSTLYRQTDNNSNYAEVSNAANYNRQNYRANTRFVIDGAVEIKAPAPSNQVEIGTGTDNTYTAPYCAMGKYSTSEMIYTPSELGSAGNIESVSFNLQSSTLTSYDDAVKIYMGYKSTTSFNGTDYVSSNNMTLVYDGTRTLGTPLNGGIWETFKLDTPFRYNGTGNLVIAVCRASNNFNVTHRYYCTNASNSVTYRASDSDPSYASGITSSMGFYVSSERPNIRLTKTNTSSTIRAKYNVYSTGSATRLLSSTANVTEMIVDNVKLASPVDTYTFTTTGEHEVLLTQDVDPTLNISFKGANYLTSIELPTSITKIGNEAFRNCTGLETVTANGNLTSIGDYAFSKDYFIQSYPNFFSLTSIGAYAFESNDGFSDLDLSASTSLTTVGEGAFSDCGMLSSIVLPRGITYIGDGAFKGSNGLKTISIDSNNTRYYSTSNCLIERSTQRLLVVGLGCYSVPSGVKTIGAYSCSNSYNFGTSSTLYLPSSVTSIEANAFCNSKFREIGCDATTPPTLNASAFSDASYTTTVRVPLGAYRSYAANSQWNKHALKTRIYYTDAVTNASELTVQNLEYTTYLSSSDVTSFRPLFVPFTSDYSLWKGDVEIYSIDNVLQIDTNNDGQIDKMVLEVVPLEASDQVLANTPYVMKAKSYAGTISYNLTNVVIASTSNIEPLTCASTKATYTFTGTYASKSIAANTGFVISNGALSQKTSSYTLSPQTWYMTVTGRSASYELPVTSMEVKEAGTSMEQKITGITLSQSSLKVVAGANTVTLTASITPSTATNTSLNWTSSNTSVATVSSSGVVTPLTKGTTTITCAAKDGSGVTATCTVTVVARGDVDGNGTFTTADIQGCVKYVMNRDVTGMGYYRDAADYNNSGAINSTDAVAIVRLVLNGDVRYNAIRRKALGQHVQEMATCLALNDVNIEAGHTATLDIDFAEQSNDYLSFQFDMILPSGVHVKEVLGGNKLNGHAVAFSERKEGFTRVICYNMQDETMHNITGSAIQIVLEADEVVQADDSHIRLSNIEIVCNDASTLCAESQTIGLNISNPTNINSLLSAGLQVTTGKRTIVLTAHSDVDVTIYSTASQLVYSGSLDKGEVKSINVPSGIYIVNGQKVMVK